MKLYIHIINPQLETHNNYATLAFVQNILNILQVRSFDRNYDVDSMEIKFIRPSVSSLKIVADRKHGWFLHRYT